MLNIKLLFTFALLFAFTSVFCARVANAQSILTMPTHTEIFLVNGMANNTTSPIKLSLGKQQIVFRYLANYRQQGQRVRFNSDVVILTFNAKAENYTLTLPRINNEKSAKQFNHQPQLTLLNQSNVAVGFVQDTLRKSGFQVGRNIPQEMSLYNQTNNIAAISVSAHQEKYKIAKQTTPEIKPVSNSVAVVNKSATVTKLVTSEVVTQEVIIPKSIEQDQAEISQMLDYWYSKANAETRSKFKEKIAER